MLEKVVEKKKKGRQGDGCDAFIPFRRGIGMDACGITKRVFVFVSVLCLRRCKRRCSSSLVAVAAVSVCLMG